MSGDDRDAYTTEQIIATIEEMIDDGLLGRNEDGLLYMTEKGHEWAARGGGGEYNGDTEG